MSAVYESLHDETILLAAIMSLTNPDLGLLDRIKPEDFSDANTGEIWSAARQVRDSGKLVSPRNIRKIRDNLPVKTRLRAIEGVVTNDTKVAEAEATVKDLSRRRRLQAALFASLERLDAADTYSEALEATHGEMERLERAQAPTSMRWFDTLVDDWLEWAEKPAGEVRVFPTPWSDLNEVLAGGLHGGRSYVIGARPGGGKSIAGANLALYAAECGHTAVMFSVEMGHIEVTSRLLAAGSQTKYGSITRRLLSKDEFAHLSEYIDSNRHIPLGVNDRANVSVEYIAATCRAIKRQRGLDVIFVDYLQLLKETDSKAARERQVAHMSRSLKLLSRELDCAVIIACQLNRNSSNEKRPPALADLRESGSIEQDADVVILLHQTDEQPGDIDLIVAKNRTGPIRRLTELWAAHQSRIADARRTA